VGAFAPELDLAVAVDHAAAGVWPFPVNQGLTEKEGACVPYTVADFDVVLAPRLEGDIPPGMPRAVALHDVCSIPHTPPVE
jgi:hypothetical protein